ncbi:MAG: ATP-binding protein [Gemmatimonadota bacterium]|jgi:signal transduction histidine kinase
MADRPPLRKEFLFAFSLLLAGAVVVAALGLLALLPSLRTAGDALAYVLVLLVADLAVLFLFGAWLLRARLVEPLERLVADVQRIAAGDYRHRVGGMNSPELKELQDSVNAMADRLIEEQARLARNVQSLDRTNRDLVEARAQVVQAARLASVGSLAAGVAHEVGNPLGAIVGYVDVARRRVERDGGDPELLHSIRLEAQRIDRIVRGLLDYARPVDTELRPADPAPVLERVRDLLESQGRLDGVDHQWDLAPENEVPPVLMEPHRLEQVMVNILLNALQAMEGAGVGAPAVRVSLTAEPGGVIRLPARREDDPPGVNYMHRRRVSRDEGGRGIDPLFTARRVCVIRVEDVGPGIPEEDLDRIFDPFFTTKEPGHGTGLGLSICARLVEGMGGRIEAESAAAGGGAVFVIRLPGARIAEEEEAQLPGGKR